MYSMRLDTVRIVSERSFISDETGQIALLKAIGLMTEGYSDGIFSDL